MENPLSPSKHAMARTVLGERDANAPLSPTKSPSKLCLKSPARSPSKALLKSPGKSIGVPTESNTSTGEARGLGLHIPEVQQENSAVDESGSTVREGEDVEVNEKDRREAIVQVQEGNQGARKRAFDEVEAEDGSQGGVKHLRREPTILREASSLSLSKSASTSNPKALDETATELATSPPRVPDSLPASSQSEPSGSQSSGTFAGLESIPSTMNEPEQPPVMNASQFSFTGTTAGAVTQSSQASTSFAQDEQAPTPAQMLRLRLKLATFKLATNQTTTPFTSLDATKPSTRASILSPPVPQQRPVLKIQEGPAKTKWSARRRAREEARMGRYSLDASRRSFARMVQPEVPRWILAQREQRAQEAEQEAMDIDGRGQVVEEEEADFSSDEDERHLQSRRQSSYREDLELSEDQQEDGDASDSSGAEIIVTPRRARSHSPPSTRGRWRLAQHFGVDGSGDANDSVVADEISPSKNAPSSAMRAGAVGVLMSLGVVRD